MLKGAILGAVLLMSPGVLFAQEQTQSTNSEEDSPVGQPIEVSTVVADTLIADELVAIVGNYGILLSDVETAALQIKERRRTQGSLSDLTESEEALETLLAQHLMATRAELDSLDKDMSPVDGMVEKQVAEMAFEAGSVAELERIHGKPIYQIKSDLTSDIKKMQLAQAMEQHVHNDVVVNKSDVIAYIESIPENERYMIPKQYSYSQIVKLPPQTEERKYQIRERMLGFRDRILSKEISLGALAQLYSADPASAMYRGEMGPMEANRFDPAFKEAAMALEPGEVSEIVESEYGYHLIELIAKTPTTLHVRHILLKPEFTVEEEKAVISQLDSIAKVVRDGKLKFGEAALIYSNDEDSKQNGGKVFNTVGYLQTGDIRAASTYFAAEDMQYLPVDYSTISSLEINQVSDPYQTMDTKGNMVQKIVRLDAILPAHRANIVDDYDLLEAVAKVQKQNTTLEAWIEEQTETIYIEIKDEFLESFNFTKPCWKEAAMRTKNRENPDIELPDYDALFKVAKERAAHNAAELAALEREREAIEAERAAQREANGEIDPEEMEEGERRGEGPEGRGGERGEDGRGPGRGGRN